MNTRGMGPDGGAGNSERVRKERMRAALGALADDDRGKQAGPEVEQSVLAAFRGRHVLAGRENERQTAPVPLLPSSGAPGGLGWKRWTAVAALAAAILVAIAVRPQPEGGSSTAPDEVAESIQGEQAQENTPIPVDVETGLASDRSQSAATTEGAASSQTPPDRSTAQLPAPQSPVPIVARSSAPAVAEYAGSEAIDSRTAEAERAPPELREVATDFYPLLDVMPPFEHGRLLRVTVPVRTMYQVGLPVSADRWQERVEADVLVGEEGIARAIRFVGYQR